MTDGVPVLYVDESFHSGENLLDPFQPVYATGGLIIDRDRAESLLHGVSKSMPQTLAEPKFSKLIKTSTGRNALEAALSQLSETEAFGHLTHKRFMVVAKMVDLLVEPMLFDFDYNMYRDGSAVALANMLFLGGPVLGNSPAFDNMLRVFVDATRRNQTASVADFFAALTRYIETCDDEWRETVEIFGVTEDYAAEFRKLVDAGQLIDSMDPAVTSLLALFTAVGSTIGREFAVVHDESKGVSAHQRILEHVHELEDPVHPGQRLPRLPITGMSFASGMNVPQLQVADWVAGAVRYYGQRALEGQPDDELCRLVVQWLVGGIWPDRDTITTARTVD